MRCARTVCALFSALTLATLQGCATDRLTAPMRPPAVLLEDCAMPALGPGATNKDLAILAVDQRASLRNCNEDKKALRDWFDLFAEPEERK